MRIFATCIILVGVTIAWTILGGTLLVRTNASDSAQTDRREDEQHEEIEQQPLPTI
jgi:hypothetical protein